ncbi:hypothetical protein ASE14_06215 [Agromyces sp. Root81]|uniref:VanZ family protein n=1 Tax=Agromyces sp. Root81 TaxID=1736601 RepID=UPI0006FEDCB7|nr:VanZ family protein [Agromyces sp. Root81]KRC60587.1 hypothetical protein ASE14_06215 [Agromyces sp. Root81]
MPAKRRTIARAVLGPYLLALAMIVFLPARDAQQVTGVVGWIADGLAAIGVPREPAAVALEFLANVALFVPFGALLALAFPRTPVWGIVAIGTAVSVGIELVQLALPSRVSTISDVIANTIGTALGLGLTLWWARARHPLDSARSPI